MVPDPEFEAARPQLTAVAFRLLGSIDDAEDAVQTTWIKAATAGEPRNPAAWLTTVLTRVCLDQLRKRNRRREEPLFADSIPDRSLAADERYLRRENISRALMVVLDRLTPAQRVAYVLHDLFDLPFREIADMLGTSTGTAKKHASRARDRIGHADPAPATASADSAVVDAFLDAAAGGDLDRMLVLMAGDCVRTVDPAIAPTGTRPIVTGAAAVAEETRLFAGRIRAATPMSVDHRRCYVIAPGGHLFAVIAIVTRNGRVAAIDIRRPARHTSIAMVPARA